MLNFNAAMQAQGVGIACIIRDAHGTVLLAQGLHISPYFVPYAKLLAAWFGLKTAA